MGSREKICSDIRTSWDMPICFQQTVMCKAPFPNRFGDCMQTRSHSFHIIDISYSGTVIEKKNFHKAIVRKNKTFNTRNNSSKFQPINLHCLLC